MFQASKRFWNTSGISQIEEFFSTAQARFTREVSIQWLTALIAGKDRTGVLAALLHSLTGTPVDTIAEDYILTRIGIEKERELLQGNLKKWLGDDAMSQPGVLQLGSVSMDVMRKFMVFLDEEYGGGAGYCRDHLGLSEQDVAKIVRNIALSQP